MKQRIFLLASTVIAFFLSAAAGLNAPQNDEREYEETPPPDIMIERITHDYPSKFRVTIDHYMMDSEDIQIFYTLRAYPDDDESNVLYSGPYRGPFEFDCNDYYVFFARPWSGTYYISAYAIADGMEPSVTVEDQIHFEKIDFCHTLHNSQTFNVDGINYKKNGNDPSTVTATYSDEGVVIDFDQSIPPIMDLWNYDYDNVVDLVIPSEITHEGQTYQVTAIDSYTFCGLENLKSLTLPPTMKTLGRYAFLNDFNLENIYISDLESWCKIHFEFGTTILGMYNPGDINFYVNNEKLTHLVIPENVDSLFCTFIGLLSLKSVVIPSSFKYMENAFRDCDSIKTVTCLPTLPPEVSNTWPDFDIDYTHLYVPRAALDAYKNHTVWGKMLHIYAIEDKGDVNGNGAINIKDCTSLICYLLGMEDESFNAAYADVNGDGIINISDVTALIDMLLAGE